MSCEWSVLAIQTAFLDQDQVGGMNDDRQHTGDITEGIPGEITSTCGGGLRSVFAKHLTHFAYFDVLMDSCDNPHFYMCESLVCFDCCSFSETTLGDHRPPERLNILSIICEIQTKTVPPVGILKTPSKIRGRVR